MPNHNQNPEKPPTTANSKIDTSTHTHQQQTQATKEQEGFYDPLLDCLVILTQLNQRPISAAALKAGLPLVKNRLTPQLFVRAAQRCDLSARIIQRPLNKINQLVLPAVLLLQNNRACVFNKLLDNGKAELILPETNGGTTQVDIEELQKEYTGFAIFVSPAYSFEKRADEYNLFNTKSWFWGTLWHYRGIYWQVLIAALFINLFTLASPMFIMNVYDRVVPNFAVETLWVLAIGVAIVICFDLLLKTLRSFLIDIAGKKADTILASTLFQHMLNIEMKAKPTSAGAFANNFHEFETLRDFFTSASVTTLVDLPFIFIFVCIIWVIGSGWMALIPLLALPTIFCLAYFLEIPIRQAVEKSLFGATQKHALLVEAINGIEVIKTQAAESMLQRRWEQYVSATAQASLKSRFFSMLAINITGFTIQLVTVIMVVVGVYLIAENSLTTGGLIACMILEGRILSPLAQLAGLLTRYNQSRLALQGLNKIMELPVERSQEKQFLHRQLFTDSIELHDVSFKYPEQENFALQNVNIKIKMGEKIGILGPMGSGKSTLEKLLLKLYTPAEGAIFIDGVDMTQLDPADIRRHIGYVAQDSSLFYGTVHSNITLSAPYANDQAILQAARIANVDQFVRQHPAGYAMPVGEYGSGLSGGQRQAIAIARAIVANPNILILDEPTSAIDDSSEQNIITNLSQISGNKTLIIVTHKPALLQLVDRLIVLVDGKVLLDGKKNDVLAQLQLGAHTPPSTTSPHPTKTEDTHHDRQQHTTRQTISIPDVINTNGEGSHPHNIGANNGRGINITSPRTKQHPAAKTNNDSTTKQ